MAKKIYIGASEVAKNVLKAYIGIDGTARKIKKAYIGINGVAKLVYASEPTVFYTGKFTQEKVTMSGKEYLLLTLLSSGTLNMSEEVTADIWVCSGGSNGYPGDGMLIVDGYGGNGGSSLQANETFISAVVTIGAGGEGSTRFGDLLYVTKSNGAAGGGGGEMDDLRAGGGAVAEMEAPFNDSYFTKYPCAGGGGGSYYAERIGSPGIVGGGGGGSILKAGDAGGDTDDGGAGGNTGGGKGGNSTSLNGKNANYYGSGGGGGAFHKDVYGITVNGGNGGAGYQGVCYVRIPL